MSHRGSWKALIIFIYLAVFWALLPAFLFGTGLVIDRLLPVSLNNPLLCTGLGWSLMLSGLLLMAHGMVGLWLQGKGLPISHLPPAEFVTSGPYRYLRHPIYVGYTAAFAGAALWMHSFWSLAFSAPLLMLGWVGYAVFYEEPALIRRFGSPYRAYIEATPLLLPKGLSRAFERAISHLAKKFTVMHKRIP